MASRFEQLRQQYMWTFSAEEREILLQGMARVGSFEQLRQQYMWTPSAEERKVLLQGMARVDKENEGTRGRLGKVLKPSGKQYNVFIGHASEDKSFVTPLALSLRQKGLEVWYDDFVLKVGDSLRREIDRGLAQSRYGIVILSHYFFRKHWPLRELDGLAAREELGKKVILPVWHNIDKAEVASYSPTLAGIVAVKSSIGIEAVTNKIIEAITH